MEEQTESEKGPSVFIRETWMLMFKFQQGN